MLSNTFFRFFLLVLSLPTLFFAQEIENPPPPPINPGIEQEISHAKETLEKTIPSVIDPNAIKILATLFGLIAFLLIAAWALRRMTGARSGLFGGSKGIKIIERRAISPKSALYLIEIEGKKVLISESQFEVRSIVELDEKQDHTS